MIHTGEKPHKCDACDTSLNCVGVLQTHKRRHTGDTLYKCDVCIKGFIQSINLRVI